MVQVATIAMPRSYDTRAPDRLIADAGAPRRYDPCSFDALVPRTVTVLSLLTVALAVGACSATGEPRDDAPVQGPSASGGEGASDAGATSAAVPEIDRLAFVLTPSGPRILVAGTDPAGRLESVWLDLLDEAGGPAAIDIDGDGNPESGQLEVPREELDVPGPSFFLEVQGAAGLERFAKRVVARAQQQDGTMGAVHMADLAPLAVRSAGEPCDPRGFDACEGDLVCDDGFARAGGLTCDDTRPRKGSARKGSPAGNDGPAGNGSAADSDGRACEASPTAGRCEDLGAARARRCAAAPLLSVGAVVTGTTRGASLWDPPDGCASALRRGRPEAVFRLRVARATPSLTIETRIGGTNFDSVVTVLDGCGARASALACNDDDPPPVSRVKLTDVAPGDYVVVVDSLTRAGGTFELAVTTR